MLDFNYSSKCPKCENIDNLTKEETNRKVHCQRCYHHYDYEKSCFDCKFYDNSQFLCMFECAIYAILDEKKSYKKCNHFVQGVFNETELEKTNYR